MPDDGTVTAATPKCPACDLPLRLMGSGERYVCDNRHYWRVGEVGHKSLSSAGHNDLSGIPVVVLEASDGD